MEIVFNNLKVDSLTSNPVVRIVSVDGIESEQSGSDSYIRIIPVEKLPSSYSKNILVYLTRNPFN
jgi:hypothetical protein